MVAQASTGLIETFWVSRLGSDALAGMALVFPGYMMMAMLSAGAVGGGIASAVARALGAGRRADADALVLHALVINLALGLVTSALFLVFGRAIYAAMGGEGASLDAALAYSNVVFAGNTLLWVMNAFASVIRGSGDHDVPLAGHLHRRRAADPALAAVHLRRRAVSGLRHRRRRRRGRRSRRR